MSRCDWLALLLPEARRRRYLQGQSHGDVEAAAGQRPGWWIAPEQEDEASPGSLFGAGLPGPFLLPGRGGLTSARGRDSV